MQAASINQGMSAPTSAGAVVNLVAKGSMDKYLSENATHTVWKSKYNKSTAFAMDSTLQSFSSQCQFGGHSSLNIARSGDLLYLLYVVIELPGITAKDASTGGVVRSEFPCGTRDAIKRADAVTFAEHCSESDVPSASGDVSSEQLQDALVKGKARWLQDKYASALVTERNEKQELMAHGFSGDEIYCNWVNNVGMAAVKKASINIGGTQIDAITSEFMAIYEELSGKQGRRLAELVGKRKTKAEVIADSASQRLLYCPLPFWFSSASSAAISVCSLQFHAITINVEFERLNKLVQCSHADGVQVVTADARAMPLTQNSLSAAMDVTTVFLDSAERSRYAQSHFESIIVQTQAIYHLSTGSQVNINLTFNHPVIFLAWVIRRESASASNHWDCFEGCGERDPIVTSSLHLNSQPRFASRPAIWNRLVQPMQHFSNIPESFIYTYSFALSPEQAIVAPSGSANFSRIDSCTLSLELQQALAKESTEVIVFARSYNLLRYREGLCGLGFAS